MDHWRIRLKDSLSVQPTRLINSPNGNICYFLIVAFECCNNWTWKMIFIACVATRRICLSPSLLINVFSSWNGAISFVAQTSPAVPPTTKWLSIGRRRKRLQMQRLHKRRGGFSFSLIIIPRLPRTGSILLNQLFKFPSILRCGSTSVAMRISTSTTSLGTSNTASFCTGTSISREEIIIIIKYLTWS